MPLPLASSLEGYVEQGSGEILAGHRLLPVACPLLPIASRFLSGLRTVFF
jgi:hypothetical protein